MNKAKIFPIAALILSVVIFSCSESPVDSLEQKLQNDYTGTDLPVVKLKTIPEIKSLIPDSPIKAYSIDPRVGVEDDYYIYNVYTPHATYVVKGLHSLVNYCYESQAIEMFLSSKYGAEIADGMGDFVKQTYDGAGDIIIHPVDSIKGIGRFFQTDFREVEFALNSPFKPYQKPLDGINREHAPGGAVLATPMREIAYKIHQDVYSLNPSVYHLLRVLAVEKGIGWSVFSVATWIIPGGGIISAAQDVDGSLSQKALTPGGKSIIVEDFIRDNSPDILRLKLAKFYLKKLNMTDVAGTPLNRLLSNASYSPRQQAYLAWYLSDMREARGIEKVVSLLARARSAFSAQRFVVQMEMIHATHHNYSPVSRFVPMKEQVAFVNKSRQFIVIPIWDHTRNRKHVRELLVEVRNLSRRNGLASSNIWFAGDCDSNTIDVARQAGIFVRKNIVVDPPFRFTTYRRLTYKYVAGDPVLRDAVTLKTDPATHVQRINRPIPTHMLPDRDKSLDGGIVIEETPEKSDKLGIFESRVRKRKEVVAIEKDEDGRVINPIDPLKAPDDTGSGTGKLPAKRKDPVDTAGSGIDKAVPEL